MTTEQMDWVDDHNPEWQAQLAREKAAKEYVGGRRFELRGYMERMNIKHHFMAGWDAARSATDNGVSK